MSKENGTSMMRFYLKLNFFLISGVLIVVAYTVLGAALFPNYVLYSLATFAVSYWTFEIFYYLIFVILALEKKQQKRKSEQAGGDLEVDQARSKKNCYQAIVTLILGNLLMLLVRATFSEESAISSFNLFPLRVLVLHSINLMLVHLASWAEETILH